MSYVKVRDQIHGAYEEIGETKCRVEDSENQKRLPLVVSEATGKILELGCAEGWMTRALSSVGDVCALDISSSYITRASGNVPSASCIRADSQFLPFEDGSFDTVVCCEVLEHVMFPPRVIYEAYRVLDNAGKLVVTVPNSMYWRRFFLHMLGRARRAELGQNHFSLIDAGYLFDIMGRAGFTHIRVRGLPSNLFRAVARNIMVVGYVEKGS